MPIPKELRVNVSAFDVTRTTWTSPPTSTDETAIADHDDNRLKKNIDIMPTTPIDRHNLWMPYTGLNIK